MEKIILKKILSSLLMMGLCCLIWTCSKEEEPQGEAAIVGDWVLRTLMFDGTETTIENGDTSLSTFIIQGMNYRNTISFSLNPNQFSSTGNTIVRFRQTGDNIFQAVGTDTLSFLAGENGTWSFENSSFLFNPGSSEEIELDYTRIDRNAFRLNGSLNDTMIDASSSTFLESNLEMVFRK